MIISQQIVGTSLSNITVDEAVYAAKTGVPFSSNFFKFDGNDWSIISMGQTEVVDITEYGISFTGTPVVDDEISIAQFYMLNMWNFRAGDGINATKLNENFGAMQTLSNNNETDINNIEATALLKDGSNLTAQIVDDFRKQNANIISGDGSISLTDNSANFLTLTGDATIVLPVLGSDDYSHTIILVVDGSSYALDVNTATGGKHLYNPITVDPTQPYSVMFIFNKLDNSWYYCITQ